MKMKLVVPAMLACLLVLGMTACPTGGGGGSSSGDSKPPTKPAITEVFDFATGSIDAETQAKFEAAYDAIWNGNNDDKQLLVALAKKTGKVTVVNYSGTTPLFAYESSGDLLYRKAADATNFNDLLKAELVKAKNDATFV